MSLVLFASIWYDKNVFSCIENRKETTHEKTNPCSVACFRCIIDRMQQEGNARTVAVSKDRDRRLLHRGRHGGYRCPQLSALMSQQLSTTFNLVNVTGGSGSIAGQQVYAAAHDGYTWLGDVAHTVSGWRTLGYADLGWEDFYGFYAASSPYVLFVSGNSPYQTAQQLFDAMRGDPSMKWGNAGLGSINQLTGSLMLEKLGLKGNSVPYDGGRSAAIKVVAGEVTWSWCGLSDILDLAQSGDIRILGICDSSPREIDCAKGNYTVPSLLDDYPELSDLQGLLYWGFRVSRDTPADAVAKIRDAFQSTVDSKEWAQFCHGACGNNRHRERRNMCKAGIHLCMGSV